jgi:hypothetical protein
MGGQQHHNLFLDPRDTAEFSRAYDVPLCFDASHTVLAANFLGIPFADAVEQLAPLTEHLHLVDGTGTSGEGVQVGEGDIDWPQFAQQLDRLAPTASFIPEIWQGHVNNGEGFWTALERLEALGLRRIKRRYGTRQPRVAARLVLGYCQGASAKSALCLYLRCHPDHLGAPTSGRSRRGLR